MNEVRTIYENNKPCGIRNKEVKEDIINAN